MTQELPFPEAINPSQLRALQVLWRLWTWNLKLAIPQTQRLRHYYVALWTAGRARQTRQLTQGDAGKVISWLQRLAGGDRTKLNLAAGTAGRHGFPERRRVRPNVAAWRALWQCARALEMDRFRLERFIREHYGARGLMGLDDLHTMADLNRVLWGMKAILRRGRTSGRRGAQKKAA